MQKFKEIQLIFLEKRHTQNANDSMHSTIEQAKREINIYHPYQWEEVMQLLCNPYNVKVMSQDEFLDFTTPLGTAFSNTINNFKCWWKTCNCQMIKVAPSVFA